MYDYEHIWISARKFKVQAFKKHHSFIVNDKILKWHWHLLAFFIIKLPFLFGFWYHNDLTEFHHEFHFVPWHKKIGRICWKGASPSIKPKLLQTLSIFREEKSSKVKLPIFQPLKLISMYNWFDILIKVRAASYTVCFEKHFPLNHYISILIRRSHFLYLKLELKITFCYTI